MFELNREANLVHLNVRKGTSEDATVSVDLRFTLTDVPSTTAAAALGIESAAELEAAFFHPVSVDANRAARFANIKWIETKIGWDGKHALTIKGLRSVRATRISKVKVNPRAAGRFDVLFSASLTEPPQGYIEQVAEMLNQPVQITLEQDPELDLSAKVTGAKPAPQGELAVAGTTSPARSTARPSARRPRAAKKSAPRKRA